jgi:hexulose-6-phosphate isomerase
MNAGIMSIGIMQGRMSPTIDGKIQFFPWDMWEKEFYTARDIGFDEIEFIFEYGNYENNPVFHESGLEKVKEITARTGVKINFVCADYFMEKPFIRVSEQEKKQSIEVLKRLITQCAKINIKGIEIPFVDNSEIKNEDEVNTVLDCIGQCLPLAFEKNILIGLETSLNPEKFSNLLEKFNHPVIFANYDTGNSASLGYNAKKELLAYGKWIKNIHIKDRVLGGGTVPLGRGDTNFDLFFKTLKKINYDGGFILQAARGENDVETAKRYMKFLKGYIIKYMGERDGTKS